MKGTFPGPIQPMHAVMPGCEERPGGLPVWGPQQVIPVTIPLSTDAKTAASKAYLSLLFTAPSDGWVVEDCFVSAAVVPNYDSTTLALERYDASANAGANLLAATTADLEALTAKEGTQLALSTTLSRRLLDEGDTIWATVTTGANEVAAGQGIGVTLVVRGPDINPQP